MKRRSLLFLLAALPGLAQAQKRDILKPDKQRLMKSNQEFAVKHVRAWSLPAVFIKHYKLEPASASQAIGVTLVGEDGNRYLLDDVMYILVREIMIDIGLIKE